MHNASRKKTNTIGHILSPIAALTRRSTEESNITKFEYH